jgi:hypothetical protein
MSNTLLFGERRVKADPVRAHRCTSEYTDAVNTIESS